MGSAFASRRGIALACVAAVLLLVALGRWERSRAAEHQLDGMRGIISAISPTGRLDAPSLAAYRVGESVDCLLYRVNRDPVALQVCFDARGRILEAIDRRRASTKYWTLVHDPDAARIRVDRNVVDPLLRDIGALPPGPMRNNGR